ncbi:acyl-CoA dehydrogenase [Klebsiella michiganensis]|uniref:Acyl-CoA dehydrogenase n=1 Tax=Klebsiella michiganensis TaxID=1134687 RepID=A0A7H4PLK8_9ENTR|nr:acyl-CoA dehydrogenase [Klebsiella michiganensis]
MPDEKSPLRYTRQTPKAYVIRSDDEAIAIAHEIAAVLQPDAAQRDRSGSVPPEIIDTYSNSGLWGITVPRQWGGAEVSAATLAQVIAIISAADPSLGQIPPEPLLPAGGYSSAGQRSAAGLFLRSGAERLSLRQCPF